MLVFIKPARPELIIRDPDAGYTPLPPEGKQVLYGAYWQRQIDSGDAVIVLPEAADPFVAPPVVTAVEATGGTS